MMLTLALTVVVPETVEPDAGEVIVTTRLPSCAWACSGIQPAPRTADRSAARTLFTFVASLGRVQLISGDDVESVDQDPGVGRDRVLAYDFDRQGVGPS